MEKLTKLVEEQAEKMAKLEEKQSKDQSEMKKLASQNEALRKQVEDQVERIKKLEKREEKLQAAEYASLIGMPANLKGNYKKEMLINLIKHGHGISPSLYIQWDQELDDKGLLQSIVDLLANAEKPENVIGQITIEFGNSFFVWPQNVAMQLKEKKSKLVNEDNEEAFAHPVTASGHRCLAEYELANKGCRFQVLLYHFWEEDFNKYASKFVYRHVPKDLVGGSKDWVIGKGL